MNVDGPLLTYSPPKQVDSLSMLYATAFVMHQLIVCNNPSREAFQRSVMLALAVLLFSVIHCIVNDLNLHSLVFASMIAYIALKTSKMIKNVEDRDWQRRARRKVRIGCSKSYSRYISYHYLMLIDSPRFRL